MGGFSLTLDRLVRGQIPKRKRWERCAVVSPPIPIPEAGSHHPSQHPGSPPPPSDNSSISIPSSPSRVCLFPPVLHLNHPRFVSPRQLGCPVSSESTHFVSFSVWTTPLIHSGEEEEDNRGWETAEHGETGRQEKKKQEKPAHFSTTFPCRLFASTGRQARKPHRQHTGDGSHTHTCWNRDPCCLLPRGLDLLVALHRYQV